METGVWEIKPYPTEGCSVRRACETFLRYTTRRDITLNSVSSESIGAAARIIDTGNSTNQSAICRVLWCMEALSYLVAASDFMEYSCPSKGIALQLNLDIHKFIDYVEKTYFRSNIEQSHHKMAFYRVFFLHSRPKVFLTMNTYKLKFAVHPLMQKSKKSS